MNTEEDQVAQSKAPEQRLNGTCGEIIWCEISILNFCRQNTVSDFTSWP